VPNIAIALAYRYGIETLLTIEVTILIVRRIRTATAS